MVDSTNITKMDLVPSHLRLEKDSQEYLNIILRAIRVLTMANENDFVFKN